ncbi:zinc-ribbon domain-containing protein [Rhodobacteraceae bacterium KMM 6894]|nr:zinc-ribbon domain-containing protein [Rhodobacteraceae bacterium KMM 6894]
MRLTCPNCGAQYEVPDDVIPDSGRDVQCSNCGDTWFQAHPDHPQPGGEDDSDLNNTDSSTWEDVPPVDKTTPKNPASYLEAEEDADKQSETDTSVTPPAKPYDDPQPAPKSDPPALERRQIDPEVAEVLREEAEREKRARAAQAQGSGSLETQPDLGLEDVSDDERRSRESRARMARLRGDDDPKAGPKTEAYIKAEDDTQDQIDPTSRRSLFPDIEEINSSLASDTDQRADMEDHDPYPEAPAGARGGFRRGFLLIVLIAVIALLIYMFAAELALKMPALRDILHDYVVWVDGLRVWLDGQIAALMAWMDTMASGADAPPAADPAPDLPQTGN